jgi:hypothetical protein
MGARPVARASSLMRRAELLGEAEDEGWRRGRAAAIIDAGAVDVLLYYGRGWLLFVVHSSCVVCRGPRRMLLVLAMGGWW